MHILLSHADLAALSEAARNEVLALLKRRINNQNLPLAEPAASPFYNDISLHNVEDVVFKHIGQFMEGLPAPVRDGLQLIADHGPIIPSQLLLDRGINIRRFQTATTRRIRALTGDRLCHFLGWDDWNAAGEGNGRYAVTPITHQSLVRYFYAHRSDV